MAESHSFRFQVFNRSPLLVVVRETPAKKRLRWRLPALLTTRYVPSPSWTRLPVGLRGMVHTFFHHRGNVDLCALRVRATRSWVVSPLAAVVSSVESEGDRQRGVEFAELRCVEPAATSRQHPAA
jgi:hypothetical protein